MTTLEEMVRALRDVAQAEAVAVINRDGGIVAAALPPSVSPETFSIMCATIHGAGMTVSNELRRGTPRRIVLESNEGCVVITEAGRRALLVVVLSPSADLDDMTQALKPFAELVGQETG